MSKTKVKNDGKTLSSNSFIGLWAGSYAVFWTALWALLEYREYRSYAFNTSSYVFGIPIIILITSLLQYRVVERFFKQTMSGWVIASVLGAAPAVAAFAASQYSDLLTSALALTLPIALVQMVWLWQRVKSAWLWPLASLMAVPLFVFPFRDYDFLWETALLPFVVLLLGLVQGVIQGVVMRYLLTQPKDIEKQKMVVATEERFDQERMNRLEEHAVNEAFEAFDDDQIAQHQAR